MPYKAAVVAAPTAADVPATMARLNLDIAIAGADGIDCRPGVSLGRNVASYQFQLLPLDAYHRARSLEPVFQATRSAKNERDRQSNRSAEVGRYLTL